MTQRFILTNVAIPAAGSALTHGLTSDQGTTAVVPNEWYWAWAGAPAVDADVYRLAGPTNATITLAATTAAGSTVDVFVSYNYSTIR